QSFEQSKREKDTGRASPLKYYERFRVWGALMSTLNPPLPLRFFPERGSSGWGGGQSYDNDKSRRGVLGGTWYSLRIAVQREDMKKSMLMTLLTTTILLLALEALSAQQHKSNRNNSSLTYDGTSAPFPPTPRPSTVTELARNNGDAAGESSTDNGSHSASDELLLPKDARDVPHDDIFVELEHPPKEGLMPGTVGNSGSFVPDDATDIGVPIGRSGMEAGAE
ncbi:unnamed protein product, partial [Discosporangium mesarthrocarpum]